MRSFPYSSTSRDLRRHAASLRTLLLWSGQPEQPVHIRMASSEQGPRREASPQLRVSVAVAAAAAVPSAPHLVSGQMRVAAPLLRWPRLGLDRTAPASTSSTAPQATRGVRAAAVEPQPLARGWPAQRASRTRRSSGRGSTATMNAAFPRQPPRGRGSTMRGSPRHGRLGTPSQFARRARSRVWAAQSFLTSVTLARSKSSN